MIKRFAIVLFLLVGSSIACIFDLPNRSIEREVQIAELIGKWELTPDTESRIAVFLKKHPSWRNWGLPWRVIILNNDGTCQVVFEDLWLTEHNQVFRDRLVNGMLTCIWELENASGSVVEDGNKDIPGVILRFDFSVSHTYYYSLAIVEENDELILWDYIGDPDSVNYQDFKKTQERN